MMRACFLCMLAVLAGCGEAAVQPDGGIADPPQLDAGRPRIDPPPSGGPRGCSWDEEIPAPSDLFAGDWDRRFLLPGVGGKTPAANGIAPLDDGSLFIGGSFASVGTLRVSNVAIWHPRRGWSAVGDGLDGDVTAVAADGTTLYAATRVNEFPALYAGYVWRFDGTEWEAIGGLEEGIARTLEIAPDGTLYAGGYFTAVDGVPAPFIARWRDGEGWSALHADGPDGEVSTILVESERICVGGMFSMIGEMEARSVACLEDGTWTALSLPSWGDVRVLKRDPADDSLVAGGRFQVPPAIGGSIARWTGTEWELIGGGVYGFQPDWEGLVVGVEFIDGVLHIAGAFGYGGEGENFVRLDSAAALREDGRWDDLDGGLTKSLGVSLSDSVAFVTTIDAYGRFAVGGIFSGAGTQSVIGVALWDGTYWRGLTAGVGTPEYGINGNVEAMASYGRCALYVGGSFRYAGHLRANNIARFDNETGWHPLGDGLPLPVVALAVTDRIPSSGPDSGRVPVPIGGPHGAVYAATWGDEGTGAFLLWDGYEWRELGNFNDTVWAIAVAEDGTVVVGGQFTRIDDQPALHIAMWDGDGWRPLADGVDGSVYALHFLEDGRLLVGGSFLSAGGQPAAGAAIWDGQSFAPLGEGFSTGLFGGPGTVNAFAVIDDVIYAGGSFEMSDGRIMANIARFDGRDWHPVGAGLPGLFVQDIHAIGDTLVAVGHFDIDGEEHTLGAFVDGAWRPFPSDTDDLVMEIEPRPEGLYIAGPFVNAADIPSVGLALFRYAEEEE